MGVWGRIQRKLWTGDVVQDYGIISDRSVSGSHRSLAVLLSDPKQGRRLFLRESYRAAMAFRINFIELDRDEVARLDEILHEALEHM